MELEEQQVRVGRDGEEDVVWLDQTVICEQKSSDADSTANCSTGLIQLYLATVSFCGLLLEMIVAN
jgi:hypothetical protein